MPKIDEYFQAMLKLGGSDLHLLQGQRPKTRQHGHVVEIPNTAPLEGEGFEKTLQEICPPDRWAKYQRYGDMDFAYLMGNNIARFRANYYKQYTGHAAVFRVIPTKILSLEQLRAPELFKDFAELDMGLVLVTGPTGSGKSTTLAAILDYINDNKTKKILTIEDPIEFVHPNKNCFFVQREVHEHTGSFSSGLRAAGREDCDIILIGEMRDLETISLAISAVEMGVLAFGTLHTNSAAKTIDRIVNVFPHDQQEQVRSMISTSLRAVVSQQLLRTADGKGRCAAHEIMLWNPAVAVAIRSGSVSKLNQAIQTGQKMGMTTMDDSLMRYLKEGRVKPIDAYMKAFDKKLFAPLLKPGELPEG